MVVKVTSRSRAHPTACASARRTPRSGRGRRCLLAVLAAAAVILAGCSAARNGGGSAAGTGGHARVSLRFQVNTGRGTPVLKRWTLTCKPAGGGQANAATACSTLLKLKNPFAPLPSAVACPMILLSNKKIVVTGTWFGTRVHRVVVDGGCDMSLFSKLDKLFG
jgi:hypothetical protein